MNWNRTILAALSIATLAGINLSPAEAFVGRLGSHSIGMIRHMQQSVGRKTASKRRLKDSAHMHGAHPHGRGGTRVATSKTKRKSIARGPSSPSYLWSAPSADSDDLLSDDTKERMEQEFHNGNSAAHTPSSLLQANVFANCPLHGGVFNRRATVKNIILHSTETAREADAQRVILSWNHKGLRHAGAQFVVDRDGVIYCTADPTYGTTHVDNRRTKGGVNNDNSIGIEMVRTGTQEYSAAQMQSVVCLVRYLQDRFQVADNHVLGHGQVQPSDRSDPVNFNWQAFASDKEMLTRTAFATK